MQKAKVYHFIRTNYSVKYRKCGLNTSHLAKSVRLINAVSGDVVNQLLDETKAGIYAPTVEDIKNTLKELYRQYKLTGKVAYRGKRSEIYKYSHREMAKKFSEILNYLA